MQCTLQFITASFEQQAFTGFATVFPYIVHCFAKHTGNYSVICFIILFIFKRQLRMIPYTVAYIQIIIIKSALRVTDRTAYAVMLLSAVCTKADGVFDIILNFAIAIT